MAVWFGGALILSGVEDRGFAVRFLYGCSSAARIRPAKTYIKAGYSIPRAWRACVDEIMDCGIAFGIGGCPLSRDGRRVRFRNVSFSYSKERKVLKRYMNLEVKEGAVFVGCGIPWWSLLLA